jgi:hypothetical protein
VPIRSDYQCQDCYVSLCRRCDDATSYLRWWETPKGVDIYICEVCQGVRERRESQNAKSSNETAKATTPNKFAEWPSQTSHDIITYQ